MFHLTIVVTDVDRFVADPAHEASATGWVEAEVLGGRMPVEKGILNIYLMEFMKQLTTFRVDGDNRARALNDFGSLFLGKLWDLYKGHAVAAAGAG